jgi:putative ABC transport system permease protein
MLMTLYSAVRVAWNALLLKKGQSALTTLGIVIGISSVIGMMSAGAGAQYKLDASLESIGKNLIIVRPGSRTNQGSMGTFQPLTGGDVSAIRRRVEPWVVGVAPSQMTQRHVSSRLAACPTWIAGSLPAVVPIRNWKIVYGRFYNDDDVRQMAPVCLLGHTTCRKLFPGLANPVGEWVRIDHVQLRVIGVLGEKGRTPTGGDQDDQLSVPITTMQQRLVGAEKITMILATARSQRLLDQTKEAIVQTLRQSHHLEPGVPDDFDVSTVQEMAAIAEVATSVMQIVVVVIASISLLVGGIGIMNIMLVSVTQRTREIGLRMAIGARPADILLQFLIEALVLSLSGGVLGLAIGLLGTAALARLAHWPLVISVPGVLLTFLVSAAIGIFFGYYPAWKASRLEPIQALRVD